MTSDVEDCRSERGGEAGGSPKQPEVVAFVNSKSGIKLFVHLSSVVYFFSGNGVTFYIVM